MARLHPCLTVAVLGASFAGSATRAQVLTPVYAPHYTITNLGPVPGVPSPLGGMIFKRDDTNTLIIGGSANNSAGALYSVVVIRDAAQHITGFDATAAPYGQGPYNDGGFTYAPNGALLITQYPVNSIGESRPGSTLIDRTIDLTALGILPSVGGVLFVPDRAPGHGRLKVVSYSTARWYDVDFTLETTGPNAGTYTLNSATQRAILLAYGPEAFVYVPPCSPGFFDPAILLNEYGNGTVATYLVNASGDPMPWTRQEFITGLSGVEGGVIDPVSGDFLFSTYGGGDRIVRVSGFRPPMACPCDWNGIDCLNSQDFFDYLTDFFAGHADFNHDGLTNSQDFFDFLTCFFGGC